ncbi:MAG: proton-conducting transporter membrane subunit [Candidatus Methanofastidiosia archaeon]
MSEILVGLVITPLISAFLLSLTAVSHRVPHAVMMRIRNTLSVAALTALVIQLLVLAPTVLSGQVLTYTLGGWTPFMGIALRMDALSFMVAAVSVTVSFLGMIYSFSYMEHIRGLGKYDAFYFLMVTGIMGVLLTRDIFNMYVFFEILSISVYILITTGEKKENYRASLKYLILGSVSSAFFLFAVGITYAVTGSLNMDYIAQAVPAIMEKDPFPVYMIFSLILVSMGVKSGLVPLHFWLPDAHSMAPSPISALLSGIVLKISIYGLLRLSFLFGDSFLASDSILMVLGVATVVVGSVLALVQKDLKRMLAYSSISQVGLIMTGLGIGTELAIQGALFHVVNHALMKSGLFLCAGVIIHQSRSREISRLSGVSPGMALCFVILSLGIVGVPPLNGFSSKLVILYGAVDAHYSSIAGIIVMASVLSCGYYFRVVQSILTPKKWKRAHHPVVPRTMSFPVYFLTALCVILGVFPLLGLSVAELAVLMGGG